MADAVIRVKICESASGQAWTLFGLRQTLRLPRHEFLAQSGSAIRLSRCIDFSKTERSAVSAAGERQRRFAENYVRARIYSMNVLSILVCGADATGKTTLGAQLNDAIGRNERHITIADVAAAKRTTMVLATAAMESDVAIIVVDARFGLTDEARNQSCMFLALGVERLVVAITRWTWSGTRAKSSRARSRSVNSSQITSVHTECAVSRYQPFMVTTSTNTLRGWRGTPARLWLIRSAMCRYTSRENPTPTEHLHTNSKQQLCGRWIVRCCKAAPI
jgi:hypothetical protein